MTVGRGGFGTPATSCFSSAAERMLCQLWTPKGARTRLAAARRPNHHEHGRRLVCEAVDEALQLRFAVEEGASAHPCGLGRFARSGSKRYAATPWLQHRQGLANRAAGRCKLRARLRRLRRNVVA